jgi:repressor of nif and glnA expression
MKTKKELLIELLEENQKGVLARELDVRYHKEVLEPRFVKNVARAKKEEKQYAKQRLEQNTQEIEKLGLLIEDLKKIVKMCKETIGNS